MTAVASRAPAAAGRAAGSGPEAAERSAAVLGPLGVATERAPVLDRVPGPVSDDPVVVLEGLLAGGLEAVAARWGQGGGSVVLSGRRAFVDVTGSAGFGPDGVLDGRVELRADLQVLGLALGSATWVVHGWEPSAELALPAAEIRGTALRVDLAALPPEVTLTASAGIAATTIDGGVTLELPGDAVPLGEPISPRIAELYRGLLGVDLSSLVVHREAPVVDAPAFVSNRDLFFAPGVYGVDAPQTLAVLDAAVRAAIAGVVGPVLDGATPPVLPENLPAGGVGAAVPVVDPPVPGPVVDAGGAVSGGGAASAGEAAAGGAPTASDAGMDGAAGQPEGVGGAAGEAVAAEPGAAGEGGGAAPTAPVLMPEAPTAPGPAAAARGGAVAGGAGGAARTARELPSADQNTADARGAVTEPVAETAARAREELAAELGERPAPSPEIVELVQRIRDAIRNNRPEDEDQLLATDPTQEAQSAGETVSGTVDGQVSEASGEYDAMSTPPAGSPALSPSPVATPPAASPGMGVDAASAAPDPLPPENTSLDADVAATDQRIADAGMETRVTAEIPDGPFGEARAARGELGELAQRTPAEIAAEEQVAIDSAQADMARLQQEAVAALRAARTGTIGGVAERQEGMTGQEEVTRENVSQRAQAIYDAAERQVTGLLTPLGRTAMGRWEAGLARHSREFHDCLDRVQRWIEERHSGVVGTIVAVGDYIAGLPSWVTGEYNRAENQFGNDIGELLLDISSEVNGVIAAAQAIIVRARTDIGALFDQMEAEFPEFAAAERARFEGLLDGLSQQATAAQTSFVRDVSRAAVTAVNEAHAAVEARRLEAGGLIGAVVRAIEEFIEDPARAIINGLLRLVNIPPAAFWALIAQIESVVADIAANPEGFLNNLVAGVKQGFSQFFDNFGTHLLGAFWRWLFSGLKTPIPMPTSFDAPALFTFALQLMGITWPNVREILVRHLGPTAVDVLEAAWELISVLVARGPQGLVDLVKEQLTPENIVGMILDAAIEYLVETLVVQAAQYIFSLLNPAGAVAQAVRLIYVVCSWIFRNAARIFAFVQAVVGGIANVISGNISGLAGVVEKALASMMVVAIDFIAGLLSLGGLPDEVAAVIVRMQTYVLGIVERIVVFLVTRARALLARLGIGSENPEDGADGNGDDELGTTVRFSAGGESHRVYVQQSGDTAEVMVASVPEPIATKIAGWRAKIDDGEPADDALRTEASGLCGSLATVADEANTEAAQLAHAFLEASHSSDDTIEPPSDDALENRERAMAGMLDRLFTIFGETRDPEIMFRTQLAMVHPQARADIVEALRAAPIAAGASWGTVRARAETDPRALPMKQTPLNQSHTFGSAFAHEWASEATMRGLQAAQAAQRGEPDSAVRKAVGKNLADLGLSWTARPGIAHGRDYLVRYKAQLHAQEDPFGAAPVTLSADTAWQRSAQPGASAAIRAAMQARVAIRGSGPAGPDLPSKVRERIWQLLAAGSLDNPSAVGAAIYIRVSAQTRADIETYLAQEAADASYGADQQDMLRWWQGHVLQDEFHHAWPQWLGGAFEQTEIFIPRALHNFDGLKGFPGGFHQVFNDAFTAAFAHEAADQRPVVNDPGRWLAYAATHPTARATVAGLLASAYATVFSGMGAPGAAAVAVFVSECQRTYPGTGTP